MSRDLLTCTQLKQNELGKEPKFGHAQTMDIFIKELVLHGACVVTTKINK
jgi:hypothetical protein